MKNNVKTTLAAFVILAAMLLMSVPPIEAAPPATTAMTVPSMAVSPVKASPARPAPVLAAPATAATPAPEAMTPEATPAKASAPAMAAPAAKAPAKKMSNGEIADMVFKIIGGIVSLVFTVLGGLGYMKWAKDTRFQKVLAFADQAFPAVEALAAKTLNEVDDKLVEFLKMIATSLKKAGLPGLTDGERALVKDVAAKKALAEKLKA